MSTITVNLVSGQNTTVGAVTTFVPYEIDVISRVPEIVTVSSGVPGPAGPTGNTGVSIASSSLASNGNLLFTYSNNTTVSVGSLTDLVSVSTANNTSFVGSVSAANVVSNTQLQSNLANYQTSAGLSANVLTLTANNTSYLGTVAAASYIQNTDSRTLSGNLVFSGANTTFNSNVAFLGSMTVPFGPSNSNTDISLIALALSLTA